MVVRWFWESDIVGLSSTIQISDSHHDCLFYLTNNFKNERSNIFMTMIRVFYDKPIDTTSDEVRNKVSQSISNYILSHWDECITINTFESDDKYTVDFSVTL